MRQNRWFTHWFIVHALNNNKSTLHFIFQDMDADAPLPDEIGKITMATEDVMNMLTMDGLTPATAARSCRDLSLDYPDYSDGKHNTYMLTFYFNTVDVGLEK